MSRAYLNNRKASASASTFVRRKRSDSVSPDTYSSEIRRTMRLKTTVHPVNMRMVKPRQHLRLLQKTLQTPLIVPRLHRGLRPHRPLCITHRKVIRQVFPHRHTLVQMRVMRQIGNPKPLTPQHPLYTVFLQHITHRRSVGMILTHRHYSCLLIRETRIIHA